MLPPVIPLFPLPNVVLFPHGLLPLHIFEPRYRAMVADALEGDRIIGMVLLKPGWERDYAGRPPVYPVGCAGLITHADPLPDGRYNIILRGLTRFRIVDEDHHRPYRLARVTSLSDAVGPAERERVGEARRRLESLIKPRLAGRGLARVLPTMADEDLINLAAQCLDFDPLEKQALLECETLFARCRSLIELLEMHLLAARAPSRASGRH
jgi:Lon protease-like protein